MQPANLFASVLASLALHDEPIHPWAGTLNPVILTVFERGGEQSRHFLEAALFNLHDCRSVTEGARTTASYFMSMLGHTSVMLAICMDGLVRGDDGGVVTLKADEAYRWTMPFRHKWSRHPA